MPRLEVVHQMLLQVRLTKQDTSVHATAVSCACTGALAGLRVGSVHGACLVGVAGGRGRGFTSPEGRQACVPWCSSSSSSSSSR